MAKVYKGTERVDKFFKHYGVKGMKWKNHRYKNYEDADRKAYASEQMAKKEEEERRKDEALDAAARKRSAEIGLVEPAELEDIDPAATRRYNERKAKEAAASYTSPAAKKRVAEDYAHGVINRRLKQNKLAAENAAKSAAGGAGNTSRIKDEIARLANERAAKEYAGRADHGSGRKYVTSEREARETAGRADNGSGRVKSTHKEIDPLTGKVQDVPDGYRLLTLKERNASESHMAANERAAKNAAGRAGAEASRIKDEYKRNAEQAAKNAAGGAGKAATEYSERKKAEREAKNAAGGAGDTSRITMEEIHKIVSKGKRSRR